MHHHRVAALLIDCRSLVTNVNKGASAELLVHVCLTDQVCHRSTQLQYADTDADDNILKEQYVQEKSIVWLSRSHLTAAFAVQYLYTS